MDNRPFWRMLAITRVYPQLNGDLVVETVGEPFSSHRFLLPDEPRPVPIEQSYRLAKDPDGPIYARPLNGDSWREGIEVSLDPKLGWDRFRIAGETR